MFGRKKKLIDQDPKSLSLEMLSLLQASLIAKLIVTNQELQTRYERLADLSKDSDSAEHLTNTFVKGTSHLTQFNEHLSKELARITGGEVDLSLGR